MTSAPNDAVHPVHSTIQKFVLAIPRLFRSPEPAMSLDALIPCFAQAPEMLMGQAWKAKLDPHFQPGRVRVGWSEIQAAGEAAIWIYAALSDRSPANSASEPNERTWQMGDVFEIFVAPGPAGTYHEFHVTPENQTLQLKIEDYPTQENFEASKLAPGPLWSTTFHTPGLWHVFASFPVALSADQDRGFFSFSRYDYQPDLEAPILSSTSPHRNSNFHKRAEWTAFLLQP